MKQATTTEAYANAVRNLSVEQAKLALSTKNLTVEQQREILVTAGLIKETGSLTVAQAKWKCIFSSSYNFCSICNLFNTNYI